MCGQDYGNSNMKIFLHLVYIMLGYLWNVMQSLIYIKTILQQCALMVNRKLCFEYKIFVNSKIKYFRIPCNINSTRFYYNFWHSPSVCIRMMIKMWFGGKGIYWIRSSTFIVFYCRGNRRAKCKFGYMGWDLVYKENWDN